MHRSEDIKDKLQSWIRHQPNLKPINFCVPGILSKCGAGTTWSGGLGTGTVNSLINPSSQISACTILKL